jgi:hypothetical protein
LRKLLTFLVVRLCRWRAIPDRNNKALPYLDRFYLWGNKKSRWFVAIHRIHRSDSDPHWHNHPFSWFSVILSGFYLEDQPSGVYKRRPGFFRLRSRDSWHRLTLPAGEVWSLFIGFARRGSWYFLVDGKPVERRAYGVLDD